VVRRFGYMEDLGFGLRNRAENRTSRGSNQSIRIYIYMWCVRWSTLSQQIPGTTVSGSSPDHCCCLMNQCDKVLSVVSCLQFKELIKSSPFACEGGEC